MSDAEQIVRRMLDEADPLPDESDPAEAAEVARETVDAAMMKELSQVAIAAGHKWLEPGTSFSRGTARSQDIAEAYIEILEAIDRPALHAARNDHEEHFAAFARALDGSETPADYEFTDQLAFEILPDIVQKHCLPFTYVGSHPGDGTDVGCWVDMDGLEEAAEDGVEVTRIEAGTVEAMAFIDKRYPVNTPYVWIHNEDTNEDSLWDVARQRPIWHY